MNLYWIDWFFDWFGHIETIRRRWSCIYPICRTASPPWKPCWMSRRWITGWSSRNWRSVWAACASSKNTSTRWPISRTRCSATERPARRRRWIPSCCEEKWIPSASTGAVCATSKNVFAQLLLIISVKKWVSITLTFQLFLCWHFYYCFSIITNAETRLWCIVLNISTLNS